MNLDDVLEVAAKLPSPSSEAASSSELLAGDPGLGTLPPKWLGTNGIGIACNPCAAPDKMSVIMKPELRIGAVFDAKAARAVWVAMGEGEDKGGELLSCLVTVCKEDLDSCSIFTSILTSPLQEYSLFLGGTAVLTMVAVSTVITSRSGRLY